MRMFDVGKMKKLVELKLHVVFYYVGFLQKKMGRPFVAKTVQGRARQFVQGNVCHVRGIICFHEAFENFKVKYANNPHVLKYVEKG